MKHHKFEKDEIRSRREFLGGVLAGLACLPSVRAETQHAAGNENWQLEKQLILASHMFEDRSFFELAEPFGDLIPQSRQVDLWIDYAGGKTSRHFDEIRGRGLKETRAYCDEKAIRLTTATCYSQLGYAGHAETIRDLGCTLCIQSSDKMSSGTISQMMKRQIEALKPALEKAEQFDCRIAIENHSGRHLLNGLDSFKAFMDLCDHPRLGIAFAPFHTQGRNDPPEAYLRECVSKVFYLYAWQQNPAGTRLSEKASGEAQMPGVGPFNFGPLLGILRENASAALISPFMHRATDSARSAELVRQAVTYLKTL